MRFLADMLYQIEGVQQVQKLSSGSVFGIVDMDIKVTNN